MSLLTMKARHHRTIPNWTTIAEVFGCSHRLLHQMGRFRTVGHHHQKEHLKLCLEGSNVSIRDPMSPHFWQWMTVRQLNIQTVLSRIRHPQPLFVNGQGEVTNRSLLKMIKTWLEGAKGMWPEELPSILWAYRTTMRITTGETPFQMTFSIETVVPVELGLKTFWTNHYDNEKNEEQLCLNLEFMDEVWERVEKRMKNYQEKMARYYNTKVKLRYFNIKDLVIGKVTLATKNPSQGNLGPTWEEPYKVVEFYHRGTYHLETLDGRWLPHL